MSLIVGEDVDVHNSPRSPTNGGLSYGENMDPLDPILEVDENIIRGCGETELDMFTDSLFDVVSSSLSGLQGIEELDSVPTKYVSSEMNNSNAEPKTSSASNPWIINLDACKTEFVYSDLDTLENELGEIYGYYELSSLSYNFEMFHAYLESKNISDWSTSGISDKRNFLDDLLNDLELVDEYKRSDVILAICYLIQGCWKDLETATEQLQCIEENVIFLLRCDGFWRIWGLLNCIILQIEDEAVLWGWGHSERIMENCLSIRYTRISLRVNTIHADETEELFIAGENSHKSLPWSPKSSVETLGVYLKTNNLYQIEPRLKIPITVRQRVNRLVQHLHIPVTTFQLQQEQLIKGYPKAFTDQENPLVERMEQLFFALLPVLETFSSAMRMVLADACPPSYPAQMNPNTRKFHPFIPRYGGDATYFVEDSTRQAEIIVKAISAILILLLKHAKLNHVYQFEHIVSEIVAAGYLPTALRFFNRNVNRHVCQRPFLQHPQCPFKAIMVDLCLHQDVVDTMCNTITGLFGLSWRNTFSHINLLRIMNKVVKGKPSRIQMLRMFKAYNCLKRCLNVQDSVFQQYSLKLLKVLCKFMDQEWKRNNQPVISAIYHKVRHRLLEDWIGEVSSNRIRKRQEKPKAKKWPWEHNDEELGLHQNVISYLNRRYEVKLSNFVEGEWSTETTNECLEVDLSNSFKKTYERWLEQEVFSRNIASDNL